MKTKYQKSPRKIGLFCIDCKEIMHYQYQQIKVKSSLSFLIEDRIREYFYPLLEAALFDFNYNYGNYYDWNIYITAKCMYQRNGNHFNRAGYHSDGFGTDDISYIWSDKQPTVFNSTEFYLSDDDSLSLKEIEEQVDVSKDYIMCPDTPNCNLLALDQYSIHRVGEPVEGLRTFVKINFSKDWYNYEQNTRNFALERAFPEVKSIPKAIRQKERNVTCQK